MSATNVTIYSTTWCAFCKTAKQFLYSRGIKYNEVNVEEDTKAAQQVIEETRQMGVPVIRKGKNLITGFQSKNRQGIGQKRRIGLYAWRLKITK